MRLSDLEVFGFKSFMQKVHIPFGSGITVVVGPNGCGKSNIVEAIRWVLGEQRASAVRSQRMEEVIFAGTRQRKQQGMAEVSVTIDNSAHDLPIEYSEVTITRRLFRSGDSDYLLNKVPCRLLDIQNLLMDTGLGPGAYSVMEQGMVDEIISEKTENRRRILEEAAGITKYKARRRSTWNKLESVNDDLLRIQDTLGELKRHVDYLGRQVGKARRYQKLKEERDEKEMSFGRYQLFHIIGELKPMKQEFTQLTRSWEGGLTVATAREAELEKRRLAVTEAERVRQEIGMAWTRCVEEVHERDGQLISARERREAREQFIERAATQLDDNLRGLTSSREQRSTTRRELETARTVLAGSEELLRERESVAVEAERAYERGRRQQEDARRQLREILDERENLSRTVARHLAEQEALSATVSRAASELAELRAQSRTGEARVQECERELEQLRCRVDGVGRDFDAARERKEEVQAKLDELGEEGTRLQRTVESDQARLHVLEKVRSGYEGYSSGVRSLLLDSPYKDLFEGVLGDLIEVEPGYFQAVETALGNSLEALVARRDEGVLDAIQHLEQNTGRAGVFPLQWQHPLEDRTVALPDIPGFRGPLAQHVRSNDVIAPLVDRLLHNTFLVDDIASAVELAGGEIRHARFVSPDGEGVDLECGWVSGGSRGLEDSSVLGRGRQIAEIRSRVAHGKARLTLVELASRSAASRRDILTRYTADLNALVDELVNQEREGSHNLQSAALEVQRSRERVDQVSEQHDEAQLGLEKLRDGASGTKRNLEAVEEQLTQLENRILEGEEALRLAARIRGEKQEALGGVRVESARAGEQAGSLQRDAERLQLIEKSHDDNINRLESEIEEASSDQRQLLESESQLTEEIRQLHLRQDELTERRDDRQREWQEELVRERELLGEIGKLQRELSAQKDRRHQLELRMTELEGESSRLRQRLLEEQGVDVESMGPVSEEGFDPETTERRLTELHDAIQRLGAVHVGVLEEYEEQKERYDFLIRQRDDLTAASEDLRKTLQLIDRTARRMFLDTFEGIRVKFRETYGRFFDGGEADLVLEPGVDPLESSIEITARPRGKKQQSIALLSGGERALTAIALLFAIYQEKPSPFCILDEVDAPLDDANVDRFIKVLKEFAGTTQFIMVTHNKLSMGAADTLHGVTMPEEGVSQMVSVQMEKEALDQAAG